MVTLICFATQNLKTKLFVCFNLFTFAGFADVSRVAGFVFYVKHFPFQNIAETFNRKNRLLQQFNAKIMLMVM